MSASTFQFDHEKLDVYQLSLQFITWVTELFGEIREAKVPQIKEIVDQLDRASISVVLNTAEEMVADQARPERSFSTMQGALAPSVPPAWMWCRKRPVQQIAYWMGKRCNSGLFRCCANWWSDLMKLRERRGDENREPAS